jgi:DNA (cytosine-5)-methyltransferase 1
LRDPIIGAERAMINFTFIDLFAGIGGIRMAFEQCGGKCVFSAEYDQHCQKTYEAFFGEKPDFSSILDTEPPGDITKISVGLIPPHNILAAGFPCQPFSLAGVSKKQSLGRPHGFADPTQGTLFFNIRKIISKVEPEAFLLENVKNLISHNNKLTYQTIMAILQEELRYDVFPRVIDSQGWVPQHRERIYIIGFRRNRKNQKWRINQFPELYALQPPQKGVTLDEILERSVDENYTLGKGTWDTLVRHRAHHAAKGQGFGYGLIEPPLKNKITRTLSARYHKDGAEILIYQKGKLPRRLTPLECCRLMGFPKKYQKYFERRETQPVSDTQAYRQLGNSVVVPVITDIAKLMIGKLRSVGAIA